MRGWLSVFTAETGSPAYQTGIVVAGAEPHIVEQVLQKITQRFPEAEFSVLAPRSFQDIVGNRGKVIWLEEAKSSPLRWLRRTRQESFDLAVLIWAGQPTFRKAKLVSWFINPRRWIIYDENVQETLVERGNWRRLLKLIASRWSRHRPGPLLYPLGWIYLLLTTSGLARRAGQIVRRTH